jgi:hypothetical protein
LTIHLGIPALVAVVGALTYLLAPGKWSMLGLVSFGAGLGVFLLGIK